MMAYPEFHGVHLDSISLFFDEAPCLEGVPLKALLNLNFSKYQLQEACSDEKNFSPGIWSLPQVFHKKLTAYSEYYFNEVNKQNILADTLRYNFSNGMQISA
ncbi:MAG: hypothetical protein ACXWRE_17245, partial [Pseudobdellovibrionaceae bacterium]